jgi:hypothetical protein
LRLLHPCVGFLLSTPPSSSFLPQEIRPKTDGYSCMDRPEDSDPDRKDNTFTGGGI